MVEWLAGNRISGTSTERGTMIPSFSGTGGWKEVARHTLSTETNPILASSIPDKRYYMVLYHTKHTSGSWNQPRIRLGNGSTDAGGNYAQRYNFNNAGDSTLGQNTYLLGWADSPAPNRPLAGMLYIANKDNKEKLIIHHSIDRGTATGSASNGVPSRCEQVGKWINTSNVLDRIELNNFGNMAIGDEVVVLGWDPDDTHSTNFWEELATVSGAGATLDTGTFAAKKYLWVQCYCKPSSSTGLTANFNSDTSGNYCIRESINGGNDSTNHTQASTDNLTGSSTGGLFFNMFIFNIAGEEKLWISNGQENTVGANAPDRKEMVGKWTNTSDAITKITCNANFDAGSILKVWGSD